MAITYRTKAGETLDWICWQYYFKEVSLSRAAMATDPQLLAHPSLLENSFLLNPDSDDSIRGAVEKVLAANAGLADYPLELPAGLNIHLPDLDEQPVEDNSVKLWD